MIMFGRIDQVLEGPCIPVKITRIERAAICVGH